MYRVTASNPRRRRAPLGPPSTQKSSPQGVVGHRGFQMPPMDHYKMSPPKNRRDFQYRVPPATPADYVPHRGFTLFGAPAPSDNERTRLHGHYGRRGAISLHHRVCHHRRRAVVGHRVLTVVDPNIFKTRTFTFSPSALESPPKSQKTKKPKNQKTKKPKNQKTKISKSEPFYTPTSKFSESNNLNL